MTPIAGIAWATVAVALAAGGAWVVRTRWLQSHTLAKCVALSLLLHAVLAVMCVFVGGWQPASWGRGDAGPMTMVVVVAEEPDDELVIAAADTAEPPGATDQPPGVEEPPVDADAAAEPAEPSPPAPAAATAMAAVEPGPTRAAPADAPADLVPLLDAVAEPSAEPADPAQAMERVAAVPASGAPPARAPPAPYADRVGPRRAAAALARGGSEATEQAVQAALAWLAANQSSDGRWNAARHGGGLERGVQGQNRQHAGARSDHGVTGLALLAFLGAGNTHVDGPHAERVARGLRFLVDRQRPDGSLAGDAEFFAALYCHGMATIALAECAALSGDAALLPPLGRAVRHTLALQHPVTGGWRYAAGDTGDTSQLGWQVMVLVSAGHAGLEGLGGAEARALGFLQRVAGGAAGGLASYRPGERPSVAMTAEALFCRLLLGVAPDHPAALEALGLIGNALPTPASYNAYTWYYATLASFHAGGPQWDRWNTALQGALLPLQRRAGGPLDGSWDPDPVWGGHGGRVYATALGALTLEVYYRHLPLHDRADRLAATP